MVIMLLRCDRYGCGWIGPEDERPTYDLETGQRKCPDCLGPVVEWPVDQAGEQRSLQREREAMRRRWWAQY